MFDCGVLFTAQWRSSVKAVHLSISVETTYKNNTTVVRRTHVYQCKLISNKKLRCRANLRVV